MSLNCFHAAQASRSAGYDTALAEIRRGRKTSHWIWYIFPQIEGLGRSSTSLRQGYGLAGRSPTPRRSFSEGGSAPATKKSPAPLASNSMAEFRSKT